MGGGEMDDGERVTTNQYWASFWGDENVLELECSNGCKILRIYLKITLTYTLQIGKL